MDTSILSMSIEDSYEVVGDYPYEDAEVTIAVMGATGSGKSTFINMVSGSNLAVGEGLKSCTSKVEMSRPFELAGRTITLIDTPGFDDTTRSDTDVLKMIAAFLSTMYSDGCTLSGIIYMQRISDFRMTGISRRNFSLFRKLCGDDTLRNVVIVTNMWGAVSANVGLAREDELAKDDMFFKPVLDKGARMMRHDNSYETAVGILTQLIRKQPRALLIQRELVDQEKDIAQTAAGAELAEDIEEQAAKWREELRQVEVEREEALLAEDIVTVRELDQERERVQTKVIKAEEKLGAFTGVLTVLATALAMGAVTYMTAGRAMPHRGMSPPP